VRSPPAATRPASAPGQPAPAQTSSTKPAQKPSGPAAQGSSASPPPPPKIPQSLEELSLAPDLPPPELSLEDTLALRNRGVAVIVDPGSGYNPYDTGPPAGGRPARESVAPTGKRTDLRKLSDWIRVQRKVEDLKKDGGEDSE
jgi:hypothetical protein